MQVISICSEDAEKYLDLLCNQSTFETLLQIYKPIDYTSIEQIKSINEKIKSIASKRNKWIVKILNKNNIPFIKGKIYTVSILNKCIYKN